MTEVTFAKSFLSSLDTHPVKLSADYVEDARKYPSRSAYTLPKMSKPLSKRRPNSSTTDPSNTTTTTPGDLLTVTVKSLRNPPLDIHLPNQTPQTSVLDVRDAVAAKTDIPAARLRLLFRKKPVAESKLVKDLGPRDNPQIVEFSVMVMGGGAVPAKKEEEKASAAADVAQGKSGGEVLDTKEFWDDLRGFLLQRVRDERMATELGDTFQAAYKAKG